MDEKNIVSFGMQKLKSTHTGGGKNNREKETASVTFIPNLNPGIV